MEADLHNLTPTVGELNSDRQNFNFGVLPTAPKQHGACDYKVDFKDRVVEPRDEIKGFLARVYFYMHDRYDMNMSKQQQQLLIAWNKAYPVSKWELERDKRIAAHMGHHNLFVTGQRRWLMGHKNSADGVEQVINTPRVVVSNDITSHIEIRGNRNIKVYHLPDGCPSNDKVSPKKIVPFNTELEAQNAGFRKAGDCN